MPCLHLYKFLQNQLNTPWVLFAKDANFIGYATTNQFLSFSSMPIANPSIFQTCIASPHDIKSIQKDCTCTTSRFFFTRKQRGIFLRWRFFFKKKEKCPWKQGKIFRFRCYPESIFRPNFGFFGFKI